MERISLWLNRHSMYLALLAAWTALCGSLYFSEVRGYVPCVLCWYQRILMYPLSAVIAVGLLRRDPHLPYYVLPLSLYGLGMSTYHYLLEKTDLFAGAAACSQGVACTTQWINWFGFVTIPFLALVAFLIVTLMSVIALIQGEPAAEDGSGPSSRVPWLPVGGSIAAVLGIFAVLFLSGEPIASAAVQPSPFPTLVLAPPQVEAEPVSEGGRGEQLYLQACAACHGVDGQGVANLGNRLRGSDFLAASTDAEVLAVTRQGRELNDPANTSGLVMPPSGGRPDLSDADLLAILQYLRQP
ncbi:MAG: c-type cytochrome [Chloroflexi bacterium]|nr:c-type cytochrome [Chloroflexota bacterium]